MRKILGVGMLFFLLFPGIVLGGGRCSLEGRFAVKVYPPNLKPHSGILEFRFFKDCLCYRGYLTDEAGRQLFELEIKEYGKKLNAFIMLYMVIATVMPSLGMTIFIVIAGFLQIDIDQGFIISMLIILGFIQFLFIAALRSIRPLVNI